ncbi:MAG: N-(5'-phosphoribosyl)anthranilate isomerase [Pseudomonadota bacterium]
MNANAQHTTSELWLRQVFSAPEARCGGIIKRPTSDVDAMVGRSRFMEEAALRRCQVVETGDDFVVFCSLPSRHMSASTGQAARPSSRALARRLLARLITRG